jgi:hypothetical protein
MSIGGAGAGVDLMGVGVTIGDSAFSSPNDLDNSVNNFPICDNISACFLFIYFFLNIYYCSMNSMKIATILNAHGETDLVLDTLDSIRYYVGSNVLVVVDGAFWNSWGRSIQLPAYKIEGFQHAYVKAPYRNLTLGLNTLVRQFGNQMDWYCYCEYDVLFTSDKFKEELKKAQQENVWCIGNDHRVGNMKFPFLEKIIKSPLGPSHYLLGCCVFYSGEFIRKLIEVDFFNNFLFCTNEFSEGFFPGYEEQGGYDFGEHLYPTLASHYGGEVGQFAKWNQIFEQWQGDFKHYPMRWKPELQLTENFHEASIMHPVKKNSELRWFHQVKRNRRRKRNGEL